jgi:hypothetical protein
VARVGTLRFLFLDCDPLDLPLSDDPEIRDLEGRIEREAELLFVTPLEITLYFLETTLAAQSVEVDRDRELDVLTEVPAVGVVLEGVVVCVDTLAGEPLSCLLA